MNQACDGASANSAVPVLPAIGTVVAPARLPVPDVTTSRMYLPSVDAASAPRSDTGVLVRGLVSSVIQRPCGISPPDASWGAMAEEGRSVYRIYPIQIAIPSVAIATLVLCANFIADGLRDALDPRTRET